MRTRTLFAFAFGTALIVGLVLAAIRNDNSKTLLPQAVETAPPGTDLKLPPKADDLRSPISLTAELHGIGVYEGYSAQARGFQERRQGRVEVKISKTDQPIVLFISAYEPVEWNIIQEPGVKLESIIVSGYHSQNVIGIAPNIPIVKKSYEKGDRDYFYFYDDDSEPAYIPRYDEQKQDWVCSEQLVPEESDYLRTARWLKQMIGLNITSIQGSYNQKTFEINNQTRGNYLARAREGGYCYRNEAGELEKAQGN